ELVIGRAEEGDAGPHHGPREERSHQRGDPGLAPGGEDPDVEVALPPRAAHRPAHSGVHQLMELVGDEDGEDEGNGPPASRRRGQRGGQGRGEGGAARVWPPSRGPADWGTVRSPRLLSGPLRAAAYIAAQARAAAGPRRAEAQKASPAAMSTPTIPAMRR